MFPTMTQFDEKYSDCYYDINPDIEIAKGIGFKNFAQFMTERKNYYNYVWISRPHNMDYTLETLKKHKNDFKIIYDAEAIFAEREHQKNQLNKVNISNDIDKMIQQEINLCNIADVIVTVSNSDTEKFRNNGYQNVITLGHTLKIKPVEYDFDKRKDILFVGNLDYDNSPNTDSVLWFVNEILPIIKLEIPTIKLHIIGSNKAKSINAIKNDAVIVHGRISDLSSFYKKAKIFIAPTRFAAGIPYKIHEAVSYGLPCVVTKLLAHQLKWKNKEQVMVSEIEKQDFAEKVISLYSDKILWENIRKKSIDALNLECSSNNYESIISEFLK